MSTYYTSYTHNAFDPDEGDLEFDRPVLRQANTHKAAANEHARTLAEGSRGDGIMVVGPLDKVDLEMDFKLFRLVPPKQHWSVQE